jgi:hypothetical protein
VSILLVAGWEYSNPMMQGQIRAGKLSCESRAACIIGAAAKSYSSHKRVLIMFPEGLAALERAAEPYINSGYRVFSQTDTSLTLMRARPRFSIVAFIILLIVCWPIAIIYSVAYRTQRDKVICLRITSQGYIEETGDTLEDTGWRVSLTTAIIIVSAAIAATVLILLLIHR